MDYKKITLEGMEYYLIPVPSEGQNSKRIKEELPSGYLQMELSETEEEIETLDAAPEDSVITRLEPKRSEHRLKYMEKRLDEGDINKGKGIPLDTIRRFSDNDLDQAQYKGEKLFFGEGLEKG